MVNTAPCCVLATPPSPSSSLCVPLISRIRLHVSPIPLCFPFYHLSGYLLTLDSPTRIFLNLFSVSLLSILLPSPFFPLHHSGLRTGSRQGLNAVQNKATFSVSQPAEWAAAGRVMRHINTQNVNK